VSKQAKIPDDVRRFILTSVPSVPYLEAALFFRRQPALRHTPTEAARALYVQPRAAADLLRALCEAGVVACEGDEFWYAANQPLDRELGRLADFYSSDLIEVTMLIHDATQQHAQRFADAFRWRRDK
jgi:hypothetical protein